MKSLEIVMNTLSAMGAKPIATTDKNGDALIKVNAPVLREDDAKCGK